MKIKKKTIALFLTVAMMFSQICPVAADTITEVPGTSDGAVEVTYDKDTNKDTVYSVTVDWTDTAMKYHVEGDEIWDPENHGYNFADDVVKTWTDDVAEVGVTNHSNAGVTASIAADEANKLAYTYDKDSFELATAEGTEYDAAPSDIFTITANDVPTTVENLTEKFVVTIDASGVGTEDPVEKSTQMISGTEFNATIPEEASSVVFTDAEAPSDAGLISLLVIPTYADQLTDVSAAGDEGVVAWLDGDIYYVSTQRAGKAVVASDMDRMFAGKSQLKSIDFGNLDMSQVTSMNSTFQNCSSLAGELKIDAVPTSATNCFAGTSEDIVLTGATDMATFEALAETAENSNVFYSGMELDITYELNGGEAENPESYTMGVDSFTLNNPTKEGYTFTGWTGSNGKTPQTTVNVTTQSVGYLAYIANYEVNKYAVTFDGNGGTTPEGRDVDYGEAIGELPDAERTGYDFDGWYTEDGDKVTAETKMAAEAVTYYAHWNIINYSITYDLNGGQAENLSGYTVEDSFTLNDPVKEGYTFTGWTGSNGDTPDSSVTVEKGSTGNREYSANWSANTYTVKYDANGGEGEMADSTFVYDNDKALAENTFTKEGYVFSGWNTSKNGEGTSYEDKHAVKNLTSENGGEVTLYAQWSKGEFTVTLGEDTITGTYGDPIGELPEANKTGYQFLGWFTSEEDGEQITSDSTIPSKDTEYYAQFEANSYTVTYDQNAGMQSRGVSGYNNCTYDKEFALPESGYYEATGNTLVGWNTESDGSGDGYNTGESVKNLTAEQNGNVTLYAQWSANAYTVKFNANGGSGEMSDMAFVYGAEQVLNTNQFEKTGYSFNGWNTESDGSGTGYADGVSVKNLAESGDVTLYAQWKINQYTVNFDGNGGSDGISKTLDYGTELGTLPESARVGYTFNGWYTAKEGGDRVEEGTLVPVDGVTYYAQWTANTYSVKYNANGGSGEMESSSFTYDVSKALTANAFTREDYVFIGWNTESDGTGDMYVDEASIKNLTSENGKEVVLYAQWRLLDGIFDAEGIQLASWDELVNDYGMDVSKDYTSETYKTDSTSPYYVTKRNVRLWGATELIIPDNSGVTSIGNYAFRGCKDLSTIKIGEGVTEIGDYSLCCNLDSSANSTLSYVELPSSLTTIGDRAFTNNPALTSIAIPSGVTSIGLGAFMNCTSLASVVFDDTTTWYISNYSDGKYKAEIDVTDVSKNAGFLTIDYVTKYWSKE